MYQCGQHLQFSGSLENDTQPDQQQLESLVTRLKAGHPDMCWATQCHIVHDNGDGIADAIWRGTAIAVIVRSFQSQMVTSAFIVEGENARNRLVAFNQATGNLEDQSAL